MFKLALETLTRITLREAHTSFWMTYPTYQATLLGAVEVAPDIITDSSQKQNRKSSSGHRLGKAAAILSSVPLKPKKEVLHKEDKVTSSSLLVANSVTESEEMSSDKAKYRRNS